MSAASPNIQPVSAMPLEDTPSTSRSNVQSLSTADDFVEIRVEYSPPRGTARTPEALNLAPAASNTDTMPTPAALPPSFADKHPAVTKALATCAASIAFITGAAASLPLYLLTAPVRLFGTALSLISPKQGEAFTKSNAFKTLTGAMGKTISIEARNGHRTDLAILGAMDICSFGISLSFVSALDVGQSAFTKTRTTITDTLSNAKQQRLAAEAQRQSREAEARRTQDTVEDHVTQQRAHTAKPLTAQLTTLLSEHAGINVAQWENFEAVNHIDTKPLSALLEKLNEGIENEQRTLRSTFPTEPTPEEAQKQSEQIDNIKKFAMKRIADVLIQCQESPDLAKQVCKIALDRGLASCTDRSATAWLAIEEFVNTAHIANHITQLTQTLGMPESSNTLIQEKIHQLLALEHKKHLSEQLKSHLDKARNALTNGGGDYIELLLDVYNLIQKANPTALQELPYKNFDTFLSKKLLHKTANQVIDGLEHLQRPNSWKMTLSNLKAFKLNKNKALLQKTAKTNAFASYLETSDAWTSVFNTLHPDANKNSEQIADQLKQAIGTLFGLPLNEGSRTNLLDLFGGFLNLHSAQKLTLEQSQCISEKNTILATIQSQLGEIVQANTPNIEDTKTLLTQIQELNEDFFDALGEAAMTNTSSSKINVEQLTPFLKQVHLFLETADKEKFSNTIMKQTMRDMVHDVEKTVSASAKAALKQAYLSKFSEDASEILNAFKLLTPPDNSSLAKFTKEQIISAFPNPVTLKKIANSPQG